METTSHFPLDAFPGAQQTEHVPTLFSEANQYPECKSDQVNVKRNEKTRYYNLKYSIPFHFRISTLVYKIFNIEETKIKPCDIISK